MKMYLICFFTFLLLACSSTGTTMLPNKDDLYLAAIANDPERVRCYEILLEVNKKKPLEKRIFKNQKYRCLGSYYAGGNGLSFDQAITFPVAESSFEGIFLERKWISEKYPNYVKEKQTSVEKGSKKYDIIFIRNQEGKPIKLHFDMTNWIGVQVK